LLVCWNFYCNPVDQAASVFSSVSCVLSIILSTPTAM
jgi:hypothetical protein